MDTQAIVLEGPKRIVCDTLQLQEPGREDIVVDISHSGISTGTERLFWSGDMPPFPGMGYPLVPGYEAVGIVVEGRGGFKAGDRVFVPGSNCFGDVRGLFGGAASRLMTAPERVIKVDSTLKAEGALLALAATARHAMAGLNSTVPDLVVGHGVLGRLLARLTIAAGAPAPTVWEINPDRVSGAEGYEVIHPDHDQRQDYRAIYDATGDAGLLGSLIGRLQKGGEIVLAGFYAAPISFAFPPAFMKEARFRVAAEWTREDLSVTNELVNAGLLSLSDLITHEVPAAEAAGAYETAFGDSNCLKMILNWGESA